MAPLVAILARGPCQDVDAAIQATDALAARHKVFLQLVNADAVYNLRHLESAWLHTERAQREGRMTAKSLGGEFLMYLSGERQVSTALDKAGIKPGTQRIVVVASGDRAGTAIWGILDKCLWSRDPAGIPTNPAAIARLGARAPSAHDPEAAVLELVALVDLKK